jgi:hypothetical protein
MRTSYCFFKVWIALLITGFSANPLLAATGVTQSWATRIEPTNALFEAGGISHGSAGDVFVLGQTRPSGVTYNHDIVVSRYNSNGVRLWQSTYQPPEGPTANEWTGGIAAHGTNVYVVATISSSNTQDFLTLKYRNTGQLEWAARLDGDGHSTDYAGDVEVDAQGNVLVVGNSIGTNGSTDIVVFKYSPTGTLLWKYYYDGPEHETDRAVGIRVSTDGSSYVAGNSTPGSQSSVVTFKLDANGQVQWIARETSTDIYGVNATSFDVDSAGNVVTFARESFYTVLWKYEANGNRQWTARYRAEEPATLYAWGVRFDGSGNIIASANLYGPATNDALVIKYAADGQQLWAARVVDPSGVGHMQAFAVDGEGNAYLSSERYPDVATIKVGADGSQRWSITYNGGGLFTDWAQFMQAVPGGDVFVAVRSVYFSEAFVSLVKYTQQPVPGAVTAVVTPALQVVDPGTNVVFTAAATGPGPVQFQWRRNGRAIPGATNATLTLTNVQVFDRGDFSVVVSNPAGATVSPEARLSVRTPPEVIVGPTQTVAYLGTETAFQATVSGNDFVTLQWRHNGTNIPGATNEFLKLVNLTGAANGSYDVVASTLGGTTTSSAAGLRISGAVELLGTTPHRSSYSSWAYSPQFHVLTNGQFVIAARSNHLTLGGSILVRKHDANGALLWSTLFDSRLLTNAEPTGLALDGAGNIYITGQSEQQAISEATGAALAVMKYSSDGQLLWSRVQMGTNVWGTIHPFAVDPDGNTTLGILGREGVRVIRYNSAGDVQWTHDDTSPDNDTIAVAVDASGNSYLGTTIRVGGDNEIRLRKFDSNGVLLWTTPDVDGIYNRIGAIAVDGSGNLIVAGTGQLEIPDSWMFVLKYSPAGQKLWETRTGSGWSEIASIVALAVGPADEITVLTMSDDDYIQEQSGLTRISANGQLKYRIGEPDILVNRPPQLSLDNFGNAYITGSYGRAGTAKYDAYGSRLWLVSYGSYPSEWSSGLALGLDAIGDVRVLVTEGFGSEAGADFSVLHYRQRHPAGNFRVRLVPDAAGTFHIGVPEGESFQIEASTDLQNWTVLGAAETQQLLQPGGTAFSGSPRQFFRLLSAE